MYIFYIAENLNNFMDIAMSLTSLGVDIISVAKILTFWFYLERFYAILDKIKENTSKSEHTRKANEVGGMFTKVFFYQLLFALTLYNITPFTLNLFNYLVYGREWTADMPLKFKSFYDVSKTPAYQITYIVKAIDIYIIGFINFAVDSIFLVCCLNVGSYFDALKDKIDETDKKQFIKEHQETLKIAEELNELFRPIIFIEFLTIAIVLCGIGVTFVMSRNFVEKSLVIGYGTSMLIQLYFYCYSGEYLMNRTANICDDLYKLDRDYCLVIKRAHKKCILRAPFF